jgi:hypothetical protein
MASLTVVRVKSETRVGGTLSPVRREGRRRSSRRGRSEGRRLRGWRATSGRACSPCRCRSGGRCEGPSSSRPSGRCRGIGTLDNCGARIPTSFRCDDCPEHVRVYSRGGGDMAWETPSGIAVTDGGDTPGGQKQLFRCYAISDSDWIARGEVRTSTPTRAGEESQYLNYEILAAGNRWLSRSSRTRRKASPRPPVALGSERWPDLWWNYPYPSFASDPSVLYHHPHGK